MGFRQLTRPLARLFRPAPLSPPTRETQVAALDSGSPQLAIATALGGGDEAVRAAAVRRLPDGEVLRKLAGLEPGAASPVPAGLEQAARSRVAELVDTGTVDFAGLCASSNLSAVLSVAAHCSDPALLSQAFGLIHDPREITRLVTEGSSSRIRQFAAQTIEDPSTLKQLLRQVRGKDNGVYKIIKQKCDVLRAEEQRLAKIESDAEALCASLERHSRRIYDPLYVTALDLSEAEWRTLEAQAKPEVQARARAAIDRCREVVAGHLRQVAQQAAEESRQAAAAAARREAAVLAETESHQRAEAEALAAKEAAQAREAEQNARSERLAAEAQVTQQISGLIGKAHGALRDGNTGRAAGLRRAVDEKLAAVAMPAHLTAQVQRLDEKLTELKEWKDYAVAPKRVELIEAMEALIGSSEEPRALADRIKQLQEDWKTISKGIVSDSEADWQRFHLAAQSAYQPCREYFEAQAKLRQDNLEKRQGVLERLRAFEAAQSGEHPDWRTVAAVLREAPQEWRRPAPVERAAVRPIQAEFDIVLGRLQARLDGWYAQNTAEKKSLIQRAQGLLGKEDGREAVDAVKHLQALWKDVGTVPREQEQLLWEEFREQCDAVFRKRHQAHADYTAGLEANKTRAAALCEEAEQTASLSGPALLEGIAKIPEWRAAFEGLGELPRADERGLHSRFERALGRCEAALSQQRQQDRQRSFTNLFDAVRRIHAYGRAVADRGAITDLETLTELDAAADLEVLKQDAEAFIAGVEQWPKGGAQALGDLWAKAAAAGSDMTAHETAFRMLCIRAEILGDKPTPPEDQTLRREYQVQRLLQHMGQRNEADAASWEALALEWVRVGPVTAALYDSLRDRFLSCR